MLPHQRHHPGNVVLKYLNVVLIFNIVLNIVNIVQISHYFMQTIFLYFVQMNALKNTSIIRDNLQTF